MAPIHFHGADANAPVIAYLGAEEPLDGVFPSSHRYCGKSIPFGSREEALKNASTLGYFNSAQAITDYAEILLYIKQKYNASHSPVIVIGGSYAGMLAPWFRLKYPHVALGALASSAPILYFDDITPQNGYYSIVTREASETCYETIMKSWAEIEKVASKPDGVDNFPYSSLYQDNIIEFLPLKDSYELEDFLESMYANAAQYNQPPKYPVNMLCGGIDGEALGSDNDILSKIFAGAVATKGNKSCYVNPPINESETTVGFRWQDIKLILQRFAGNIIFSNGLRDPYSSGGVLEDALESVVAIHTANGRANQDSDPDWLVIQRKAEVEIIEGWISKYYADLKAKLKSRRPAGHRGMTNEDCGASMYKLINLLL
ncbi:prolylcarboxypeptidase-like protein [Citrus sinensis]|uniref:Prolylcarboxypeptidase-like protein n=1 Tax=Citrus sinensis TaxID=2711 RepID=A0ACB8IT67_CITSI|nr:prolylcarboxypeptidase-like protein [Citrus sinensis]